jgi:tetratricopeptide (TPR) repeat protein
MNSSTHFPASAILLDDRLIHHTLEHLRRAEPLDTASLRRLAWITRALQKAPAAAGMTGFEALVADLFSGVITDTLSGLRRLYDLPAPADTDIRQTRMEALDNDFSAGNSELEAWSALYYRFVCLDLNLQVQEMAHQLGIPERQVHRRLDHGLRRLTLRISQLEAEARAADKHLWMQMQIPPALDPTLIGREALLAELILLLDSHEPPALIALTGTGGVGKTALAQSAAHAAAQDGRFEALAWISLSMPVSLSELILHIAELIDYPYLLEANPADRLTDLRAALLARPALIVIDQMDYLTGYPLALATLSGIAGAGRMIVTAQEQSPSDLPIHQRSVPPLEASAHADLIRHILHQRQSQPSTHLSDFDIEALYQRTGGNPLAAHILIGQLASLPLDRVLEKIDTGSKSDGAPVLGRLFSSAWGTLSADARVLLSALSTQPDSAVQYADLGRLIDLPGGRLDAALAESVRAYLLEFAEDQGVYTLPPAVRSFGRSHAAPLSDAAASASELAVLGNRLDIRTLPTTAAEIIAQVAPAARRSGQWGLWRDALEMLRRSLEADSQPDPRSLGRVHLELGVVYRWLGEMDVARSSLERAVQEFGEVGDFPSQVESLIELGVLVETQADTSLAMEAYQRAASASERYQRPDLQRRALQGLAGLALGSGDTRQAIQMLQQAQALLPDEPDGAIFSLLGNVFLQDGQIEAALEAQQQAIALFQQEVDLPRLARAHLRMGVACQQAKQADRALHHLGEGLALMRALGDALGQARILNNLGVVYAEASRLQEALDIWQDALVLQQHLEDRVGMAYTWLNLAETQWKLGQIEFARNSLTQARDMAEMLDLPSLRVQIANHPIWQDRTT